MYVLTANKKKFNAYKHRNKLNSIIRAAKAKYINDIVNNRKKDCRKVWKLINSLIGKSVVSKCHLINTAVDDLNNFFVSQGTEAVKNIVSVNYFHIHLKNQVINSLYIHPVL